MSGMVPHVQDSTPPAALKELYHYPSRFHASTGAGAFYEGQMEEQAIERELAMEEARRQAELDAAAGLDVAPDPRQLSSSRTGGPPKGSSGFFDDVDFSAGASFTLTKAKSMVDLIEDENHVIKKSMKDLDEQRSIESQEYVPATDLRNRDYYEYKQKLMRREERRRRALLENHTRGYCLTIIPFHGPRETGGVGG